MFEASVSVHDSKSVLPLFGTRDQHVRKIRKALGVSISDRENMIHIKGERQAVSQATEVFEKLKARLVRQGQIAPIDVDEVLAQVTDGERAVPDRTPIETMNPARQIRPRTKGQAVYLDAIAGHELVFAIGPAGTGKTYLAVAMAVSALRQERVRKIVLVRPAVEAGESLGFLPGDLEAKINPYLRPLLDAVHDMMDYDAFRRYSEQGQIEVIPLAYMRGRTLNESFIILDEAQNTTVAQMKMFLTRMGMGSKIVVAGDVTQTDLPTSAKSGLIDALRRLRHIDGFCEVQLTADDIVRHRLVQAIVNAYEEPQGTAK
ncbi:MAG: PhoH family protein [Pirellulales bacterium]